MYVIRYKLWSINILLLLLVAAHIQHKILQRVQYIVMGEMFPPYNSFMFISIHQLLLSSMCPARNVHRNMARPSNRL